jgi:hypothetical protein
VNRRALFFGSGIMFIIIGSLVLPTQDKTILLYTLIALLCGLLGIKLLTLTLISSKVRREEEMEESIFSDFLKRGGDDAKL